MTGLLTGHSHLKGHVFDLELVKSPKGDTCKQAYEMVSHVLCDCEASATESGIWVTILWNQVTWKTSLSVRYCTLFKVWDCWMNDLNSCTKDWLMVEVHRSLWCLPFCILGVLILHSFVLMSPWGWPLIAETCKRVHVYRWFVILNCVHLLVYVHDYIIPYHWGMWKNRSSGAHCLHVSTMVEYFVSLMFLWSWV
jgi:hypothetical protein